MSNSKLPIILLIVLALIWGSSFILMKRALIMYSPTQVACLRMGISFICLLPISIVQINKIKKKYWPAITATGFLGNGIPAFLFTTAQVHLSSSVVGVLNSLVPIFTLVVSTLFFGGKITLLKVGGILLGLMGAFILMSAKQPLGAANGNLYGLLIVMATICYAFSVNITKNYLQDISSIGIASLALCIVGPLCLLYLFVFTDFLQLPLLKESYLTALGYAALLSVLGTTLSLFLFNKLVKVSNALYASSVTYLIPIVALLWGKLDGEPFTIYHFLGMLVILAGVFISNKKSTEIQSVKSSV